LKMHHFFQRLVKKPQTVSTVSAHRLRIADRGFVLRGVLMDSRLRGNDKKRVAEC
jgi:hypothetical protein